VEFQDFDTTYYTSTNGSFRKDSNIAQWTQKLSGGVKKFGIEPDPGPKLENWVSMVSFYICVRDYKLMVSSKCRSKKPASSML
jgi:hypothetical protein